MPPYQMICGKGFFHSTGVMPGHLSVAFFCNDFSVYDNEMGWYKKNRSDNV
jgi:hypothetical protein